MKGNLILGAAIGDCVHVAGVVNFLDLAEQLGYDTVCLGPAIGVDELLGKVAFHDPAIVAVGYRLTPANCRALLEELSTKAAARAEAGRSWLFGGTEPCVAIAREIGLFRMTFASGISKQSVVAYLRGEQIDITERGVVVARLVQSEENPLAEMISAGRLRPATLSGPAPRPSGPVKTDQEAGQVLRELRDAERY